MKHAYACGLMPMANKNASGASSGLRPMAKASGGHVIAAMQYCKAQFPLCPHNKALGSWICIKDGHLGCKACHLMGCASLWGAICVKRNMMRKSQLQRHQICPMHLDAVARLTKCDKCKASSNSVLAPSKDAFQAVWRARCSGGPSQSAIEKVCGKNSRKEMGRSIAHAWPRAFAPLHLAGNPH